MTKKSHSRLMRDTWSKDQLLELIKLAEYSPEEEKEVLDLIKKWKIK